MELLVAIFAFLDQDPGHRTREEILRVRELGRRQEELARTVEALDRSLRNEKAPVFRFALDRIREDMTRAAAELRRPDTGAAVQQMQAELLKRLRALADHFGDFRKGRLSSSSEPGRGRRTSDLAELRLLRELQKDLLARTQELSLRLAEGKEDWSPIEKVALRSLSGEQGRLAELVRELSARDSIVPKE